MIVIIDYGMGNVGSIQNMLSKIGTDSAISSDLDAIKDADKLILPGVGAFDNAMVNLKRLGIIPSLEAAVLGRKVPVLGICLGMQLFSKKSEEGSLQGLGWIDAETVKFKFELSQSKLKIPHMGWNEIQIRRENHLLCGFKERPRFYFVHSYFLKCNNSEDVIATSTHGIEFAAAVNRENIWGTQFHPEKSHKFGLQVLKHFCDI